MYYVSTNLEESTMEIIGKNNQYEDDCKLYSPYLLKGMQDIINRVVRAINNREKIVICGCYDFDSIAGISALFLVLKYLNADVEYFIPDDISNDYTISCEAIDDHIKYLGANLLITVGCGSNSKAAVEHAKILSIDVIVTDNHKIYEKCADAFVINPNSENCSYPFKYLSGAGVVFKLCEAISSYYSMKYIYKYTDLVMLGTISSKLPIIGENKAIFDIGMCHLKNTHNYGLKALVKVNNINDINFDTVSKLVGKFVSKGNLKHRMNNARIAIELFTTTDSYRAEQIAKYLNKEISK